MNIKIRNGKIKKIGNSYHVVIPMGYIKNGLIDPKKEYNFIVEEKKEGENEEGTTKTNRY